MKKMVLACICAWVGVALTTAGCGKRSLKTSDVGAALTSGWQNFRLSEYDLAVRDFEAALTAAEKGSDEYFQALFGLANVWNLRRPGEKPDQARELYSRIIREAPTHDLAAWSELALARMLHVVPVGQDPDYERVRAAYREIIRKYPGHLATKEATIYLNATLVATLDPELTRQAISNLQLFVLQESRGEFIQPAWSLMAVGYNTLGLQRERLDAEIRALETTEIDPVNPFNEFAWQYWNIATIAEFEVGDFDLARQYYKRLIDEYPQDVRVYPALEALARMDRVEAALREGREVAP